MKTTTTTTIDKSSAIFAAGVPVHCAHDAIVDTSTLVLNPNNPNRHSDEQIRLLAGIIKHQGWRWPIKVSNRSGFVVSGHGRLVAAQKLGLDQVPVDYQDYDSEADEWADLIADNRIRELATWDDSLLTNEIERIRNAGIDIEITGYTDEALAELMGKYSVPEILDAGDVFGQNDKTKQALLSRVDNPAFTFFSLGDIHCAVRKELEHAVTKLHGQRGGDMADTVSNILSEGLRCLQSE
jgi:hypothetical protein